MKLLRFLSLVAALFIMSCGRNEAPENLNGLPSRYVQLNDSVSVHYKVLEPKGDVADAKTLCFVHGFGCDLDTWTAQYNEFKNDGDKCLIFIDLPGFGKSSKPRLTYDMDYFSDGVLSVIDCVDAENVVLIGHSLGTPVCRWAAMRSDKVIAMVDVDGVYCFYDENTTPEYLQAINEFGRAFDGATCAETIRGFVTSLSGPETPDYVKDYAMSVMPETPEYVASSVMRNLVQQQWWPNKPLGKPAMVICTQNSGLDPDNEQKMLRLYPDLGYTELTTCGHFIQMEQPELFNGLLRDFVSSIEK